MKTKILLILTVSILIFSGCSTKLAYNYLDWILEWYAEDLVTLSDEQEWALTSTINQELDWHRKHQLPMYIASLDELSSAIRAGLTKDAAKHFYSTHEKGWMELKMKIVPNIAQLLKSLNDSQVEELGTNLKNQEQELSEKYVDKPADELISQRTERMTDRIEDWTGTLNNKQKQLINDWSHKLKQTSSQWIETRKAWQGDLMQIVRQYRDKPTFDHLITDLFKNSRKHWPKWYYDAYYHNVDLTLDLMVSLERQLTVEQKKTLLNKISALRQQFVDLHNNT